MTRSGSRKTVGTDFARGRLENARAYLQAARDALQLAESGTNANPAMSQIVNAAIAYADALTSLRGSLVNQKDHGAAAKTLREVFRGALPTAQETRLRRILAVKDEVQYGAKPGRVSDAESLLRHLEKFAAWAEEQFL
ncbi:MAG TPA: hypothetical protein VHA35_20320 [Dongiaceae bacterium]|jgi:hypothetical protein|nr:hypothetical protein [Dongiaceae bacterium]